jgi:two-component system sensor kinase FixL
LKIVFGNLIRNARDAMANGGRLEMTARPADGNSIEIVVVDTGVGIKPEDLERIMEPLYSTKARGIGLGLAITRAIIDKHHGRLRVTSEPGKGSRFSVTLPAAT